MLFPFGKDNVKVRFETPHSSLLEECFKHLARYEVNENHKRGIPLFNIRRDGRACRKKRERSDIKTLLTVKQNEVSYCVKVSDRTGNNV